MSAAAPASQRVRLEFEPSPPARTAPPQPAGIAPETLPEMPATPRNESGTAPLASVLAEASSGSMPSAQATAPVLPAASAPAAPPPASSSPASPASAPTSPSVAAALEQFVDQVAEAREAGRSLRPEITLRHHEFGQVAMRVEASGNDWRATLSARDPAFVPAVQAALAERLVAAPGESGLSHSGSSPRGQDGQSHSQSHSQSQSQSQTQSGFAGTAGGNGQHYGSSPGSAQGSAKPSLSEEDAGSATRAAPDQSGQAAHPAQSAQGRAMFA